MVGMTPSKFTDSGSNNEFKYNKGYITENSGSASITTGQTTVSVNHGLATTLTNVVITPTSSTGGKDWWVSGKAASQFTINIDSTHTSDISFDWYGEV